MPPVSNDTFEPVDYFDASCADGKKVYAWLEERGLYPEGERGRFKYGRQLRRWANAENPSIETLDMVLIRDFETSMTELPDDVWLKRSRPNQRKQGVIH